MEPQYKKASPIRLKDLGKDEKWLQDRINDDPSILGLGDLEIIRRERSQSSGGRLDFLMYDPEDEIHYEVEVMLGTLDESHIIRTIEYWDIERKRYPSREHRAVIVAEEITNRFFNVIGLLNKSVPIIAVQLNAFVIDSSLVLHFVKVLDVSGSGDETEQGPQEQVDRKYWESKTNPKSIEAMDKLIKITKAISADTRVTYNKYHVAIGTTGTNFCWCHPRKGSYLHIDFESNPEERDKIVAEMEEKGIECRPGKNNSEMKINLTTKSIDENLECLKNAFTIGEKYSRE